jgi:hypothetical protein
MKRPEAPPNNAPEGAGVALPDGAPKRPYIHPAAPTGHLTPAQTYGQQMRERQGRRAAVPKTTTPVAGGPAPQIPRLDGGPARGGMTMSQHAQAVQDHAERVAAVKEAATAGFVEPPNFVAAPESLALQPMDILPQEAQNDPEFITGQGSMFAGNQPRMAMKYGVVRDGNHIPPQELVNPGQRQPGLSEGTLRDIEQLRELEEKQSGVPAPRPETTELGAAAGTVGNVPGDESTEPLSDEEREQLTKAVQTMDEFEFDTWRQTMMRDILNNPEQQQILEARLEPLDIGDLITANYVTQRVPVIPGKFELVFKSTDGETDLAIKRIIMEDSRSLEVSDRYYLDKFSLMSMAALLHGVNNKTFKDHRNTQGDFDDGQFREKFQMVMRLPTHMLASIGVHAMWFEHRVRKLFAMEQVGNG